MKVTIKDKEALNSITPDDLLNYLNAMEWEKGDDIIRDDVVVATLWKKYSKEKHRYSYVRHMHENHWADYSARMAENLMEIEQCEDLSQIQIYVDITGKTLLFSPYDVKKMLENIDFDIGDLTNISDENLEDMLKKKIEK